MSAATAGGVLAAIDRDRFAVIPIGITREGIFVLEEDRPEKFGMAGGQMPEVVDNGTRIVWPEAGAAGELRVHDVNAGDSRSLGRIDVVLPILHGLHGEDGTMQGFLDILGLPYAGCGVLDSAISMDKHFMKVVLNAAGVPVSPGFTTTAAEWKADAAAVRARAEQFPLPWFVKPARAGSSVGVSKVNEASEFAAAMQVAFVEDSKVLVEQGMAGREVEVAVLAGKPGERPRASLPGEIVLTTRDFYDFEGKYLGGDGVELKCPAELDEATIAELRDIAVRTFEAVDGQGLARVDFFVTAAGPVVNELNTMPGFTPISMFPQCWIATGMPYTDLITYLLENALERK